MRRSAWQLMKDAKNYNHISKQAQKELYDSLFDTNIMIGWNYSYLASLVADNIDGDDLLDLIAHMLQNKTGNRGDYLINILVSAMKKGLRDETKDLILKHSCPSVAKALLYLNNLSEKEEEVALRSISTSKYIPSFIYDKKYKPSKKVMEKLPPVMRLKVLESFTSDINLGYNILENFDDFDEFRKLLFGSVLRHRDRVERVIKRYSELSTRGILKTFDLDISCNTCGNIKMTVTTGVIKNAERIKNSGFGRLVMYGCPICRKYGTKSNITWR